jgi:micrococcal nuclease
MKKVVLILLATIILVVLVDGRPSVVSTELLLPEYAIESTQVSSTTEVVVSELDTTSVVVPSGDASPQELYEVVTVVDGDTIDVRIDEAVKRVRYIGVNTPETVHPTRGVECFGKEASARNKTLVAGKYVRLEKDISETDKYGRLLRYVYVGDVFVNELLVAEGYASVSTYPPDVRHTETFLEAQRDARTVGKGLWGAGCEPYVGGTTSPSEVVESGTGGSACTIKGNISSDDGERIYHTESCPYYDKTVITETKGERWFCSENDAVEAGWRKALNCN